MNLLRNAAAMKSSGLWVRHRSMRPHILTL